MEAKVDSTVRCEFCEKVSDLIDMKPDQIRYRRLPNTLTDLPDHNNATWLCKHCDCWN